MQHYEYPKVLAAAKKAKGAEWSLADALLEAIPRGSEAAFRDCAEYLTEHGIEYGYRYLNDLHGMARRFPRDQRTSWLTPANATAAGSPAVVEAAVEIKKEKVREEGVEFTPPTYRELQAARKTVMHHARSRTSPEGKPLPARSERGARPMPTRQARSSSAKAPVSELRHAADVLGLGNLALKADALARQFVGGIAGQDLDTVEREALEADCERAIDGWKVALAAVKNPLGKQIERFLEQEGV